MGPVKPVSTSCFMKYGSGHENTQVNAPSQLDGGFLRNKKNRFLIGYMNLHRLFCMTNFLLIMTSVLSQSRDSTRFFSVDLSFNTTHLPLEEHLSWWEDTTSAVDFEQAREQLFQPYSELKREEVGAGSTFWGKLSLINPDEDSITWIFSFGSADTLVLCQVPNHG